MFGNPPDDCGGCCCAGAGATAAGGRGAAWDLGGDLGAGTGVGTPCARAAPAPSARLDSNAAMTAVRLPMLSSDCPLMPWSLGTGWGDFTAPVINPWHVLPGQPGFRAFRLGWPGRRCLLAPFAP